MMAHLDSMLDEPWMILCAVMQGTSLTARMEAIWQSFWLPVVYWLVILVCKASADLFHTLPPHNTHNLISQAAFDSTP
jgi:hypothetical protein